MRAARQNMGNVGTMRAARQNMGNVGTMRAAWQEYAEYLIVRKIKFHLHAVIIYVSKRGGDD